MPGNPLGPRPRSLILPWARSHQPGYVQGGNKFDLDKWDPEYFARLRDFIAHSEGGAGEATERNPDATAKTCCSICPEGSTKWIGSIRPPGL